MTGIHDAARTLSWRRSRPLNDVVAGHVPIYFADAGPAAPLIQSGELKALGVTTATRSSNIPDVPTLEEAGVTGYEANTWQMMVGPPHMAEPIVMKLNRALGETMLTPEAQAHFISLGMQPRTSTPAEAAEHYQKVHLLSMSIDLVL